MRRALAYLRKGHTRRDFVEAAEISRAIGLTLVPTFVAFHPWLTLDGYCDLLDTIAELDLVDHVPSIQLAIRLLIPDGSKLLDLEEVKGLVAGFDALCDTRRGVAPREVKRTCGSAARGAQIIAIQRVFFTQVLARTESVAPTLATSCVSWSQRMQSLYGLPANCL